MQGSKSVAAMPPGTRELQLERGSFFRDAMKFACKTMTDGVASDKIAICLSGGADSTTVLWNLLDLGKRPTVFTFQCPENSRPHSDMRKAVALAEHYGLPYKVIILPTNADYIGRTIHDIHNYGDLVSQPDHEVLFVFHEMMKEAAGLGFTHVFTGLGDQNFTMAGRHYEQEGRAGRIGAVQADFFRASTGRVGPQSYALTKMGSDLGIYFCQPNVTGPLLIPYQGLTWDEMNREPETGRLFLKYVTLAPYLADIRASKISIQVKAMQSGDTGLREYFDKYIPGSSYVVRNITKRRINTAKPYYNALNRLVGESIDSDDSVQGSAEPDWKWIGYLGDGTEAPNSSYIYDSVDFETGRAYTSDDYEESNDESSSVAENTDDEFSLFDFGLDDESSENGESEEYDTRVDCLGHVFGDHTGLNTCPRAIAGLCGLPATEDNPLNPEECTYIHRWLNRNRESLAGMSNLTDGKIREAYEQIIENSAYYESLYEEGKPSYNFFEAPHH